MMTVLHHRTVDFYGLHVQEKYQMDAYLDQYYTNANTQPKATMACHVINSVVHIWNVHLFFMLKDY